MIIVELKIKKVSNEKKIDYYLARLNILKKFKNQIQTIFDNKYFISSLIESNISISSKLVINKIILNILTLYFNDEEIIKDIMEYLF